jgi:hypothetical protein
MSEKLPTRPIRRSEDACEMAFAYAQVILTKQAYILLEKGVCLLDNLHTYNCQQDLAPNNQGVIGHVSSGAI